MSIPGRSPSVSVVIPTHNRPHLLPRAVASAFAAGTHVEVIVVDDASVDDTARVCARLDNITYVRLDQNRGVAGARNAGIAVSRAPYIAFLDDDDERVAGSIDRQIAALEREPDAAMAWGAVEFAGQSGRPTGRVSAPPDAGLQDAFWSCVSLAFSPVPCAVMARRARILEVGSFDERLSGIDDWDLWARMAERFPVWCSGETVALYREPTPTSGQGSSDLGRHYARAARHQRVLFALPRARSAGFFRRRRSRRLAQLGLSARLWSAACDEARAGAYRRALTIGGAALRINPSGFVQAAFVRGAVKDVLVWPRPA